MAREFNGLNERIAFGDIPAIDDALTLTVSAWVWNNNDTSDGTVCGTRNNVGNGFFLFRDDVAAVSGRTDTYAFLINGTGGNPRLEGATGIATANVWQHVLVTYTLNAANGINLWVNGVKDANSPVSTAGVTAIGGNNGFNIGETNDGLADRNGRVAEVGCWNRVLSDKEIIALSKGYAPSFIRNGLVFYAPLFGTANPEPDIKGKKTGTLTGTVKAKHPKIIYPR